MPPIGLILGKVDFSNLFVLLQAGNTAGPYASLADAKTAGAVTMNYGLFVNAVISFVIVAFVLFLIIRSVMSMKRQEAPAAPTTKDCPFCLSKVPVKASRCAFCTSELS
jgi:large conductance mechanosensitive channel